MTALYQGFEKRKTFLFLLFWLFCIQNVQKFRSEKCATYILLTLKSSILWLVKGRQNLKNLEANWRTGKPETEVYSRRNRKCVTAFWVHFFALHALRMAIEFNGHLGRLFPSQPGTKKGRVKRVRKPELGQG